MASRSPRACSKPGCGRRASGRFCARHQDEPTRLPDRRPSSAERGYGWRWQKYRKWFLSQPENLLCACGCGGLSQEVDHIEPVTSADAPGFWEPSNHQGLTKACHSRKTLGQDRLRGRRRGAGNG